MSRARRVAVLVSAPALLLSFMFFTFAVSRALHVRSAAPPRALAQPAAQM
jgi:hypothetical protein